MSGTSQLNRWTLSYIIHLGIIVIGNQALWDGLVKTKVRMWTFATLAAELETPCVTLRMSPPTLPYLMSSFIPSVTSFSRPMGFPRKSTEPRIWAAWLISSYKKKMQVQELLNHTVVTQTLTPQRTVWKSNVNETIENEECLWPLWSA